MKITYILIILLSIIVIGGVVYVLRPYPNLDIKQEIKTPEISPIDDTKPWPPRPEGVNFDPIREVKQVILKTNKGDIEIALDGTRAPLTVGNFIYLAEHDFYDGTSFHRVIPDFMIQGGDPFSKDQLKREQHGQGGPVYKFQDEINANSYGLDKRNFADIFAPEQREQLTEEAKKMTLKQYYESQGYQYTDKLESLPLQKGVIAMANSGPNTNGSQFFIITANELPHLEGKHTPFGIVQRGMDVVMAIAQVERDEADNPIEPVIIEDVVILSGGLVPGLDVVE